MGNSGIHVLGFFFLQLLPHWEKTFGIDLSSPQIGVIDADDVSPAVQTLPAHTSGQVDSPSNFDGQRINLMRSCIASWLSWHCEWIFLFQEFVKTAPLHTLMYLLVSTVTLPTLTKTKRVTVYSLTERALTWSSSLYRLTVFGWT